MGLISTKLENLWFKKDEVKYVVLEEHKTTYKWIVYMGIGNTDFAVFGSNDKDEALEVVKAILHFVERKNLVSMGSD